MYGTVDDLRLHYLQQVGDEQVDTLTQKLTTASAIVDRYLGFTWADYGAPSVQRVAGYGASSLRLPPHQPGSVTSVDLGGFPFDPAAYQEQATGSLIRLDGFGWGYSGYDVTAKWGYGPIPADVLEVVYELAVNLFSGKDARMFTDVIGVEGEGGFAYQKALTNLQKMTLDTVKVQYLPVIV